MRKSAVLFVVSVLILGMFVFTSPKVKAQGAAPGWSIGDYWEYVGAGNISGAEYSVVNKYEVKARENVTIGATSYDAFHITIRISMVSGSTSISMEEDGWVRTSDCASIKTEMNVLGMQMTMTFDPPQENFNFPLSDGKSWSSTSIMTMSGLGIPPTSGTVTTDYLVAGPLKVTVPAGTFETFNVTGTSGGSSSSSYYSDQVGFLVKTGSMSTPGLMGFSASALELRSYNYQKMSGFIWLVMIVIIVVAVVAALVVALMLRSRRKTGAVPQMQPQGSIMGQPPQQMPPPNRPPMQPPQT